MYQRKEFDKAESVMQQFVWNMLSYMNFWFFLNVPLLCKSRISQVLRPNLQFLWFIWFLNTFLLWFVYYKRFNTGLALDYQPPVTLYCKLKPNHNLYLPIIGDVFMLKFRSK